jgi:peptidoglycan/xylan/chitin deacetylase (PgdA/CDA1 family)
LIQYQRKVAVTVDDLPMQPPLTESTVVGEVIGRLVSSLASIGVPVVGFVNEGALYRQGVVDKSQVAHLEKWCDARMELGNHTCSHLDLHTTSVDRFKQDIIRGEVISKRLMESRGTSLRFFRYPYLHTGLTAESKTAVEEFLRERGLLIAPVTIQSEEYMFAQTYDHAMLDGDSETMHRIASAYIPYMKTMFEYFETLSLKVFGREISQVLLLHASALNADYFSDLEKMMRDRGYSFVTLEEALDDEAYSHPDSCITSDGLSWLRRWAATDKLDVQPQPTEPDFVTNLWNEFNQRSV